MHLQQISINCMYSRLSSCIYLQQWINQNFHFINILPVNSATISYNFNFIDSHKQDLIYVFATWNFSIREEEMKKNKKSLNYILRINTPALEHPKHMVLSLIEMSQGCQTVTSSDILLVLLALHQHDARIILFCQCLTFGVGGNKR